MPRCKEHRVSLFKLISFSKADSKARTAEVTDEGNAIAPISMQLPGALQGESRETTNCVKVAEKYASRRSSPELVLPTSMGVGQRS